MEEEFNIKKKQSKNYFEKYLSQFGNENGESIQLHFNLIMGN